MGPGETDPGVSRREPQASPSWTAGLTYDQRIRGTARNALRLRPGDRMLHVGARDPDDSVVTARLDELDFPDGTFDAVLADRVLERCPDPGGAIAPLLRVLRVGGRFCAVEADWHSLSVEGLPEATVDQMVRLSFGDRRAQLFHWMAEAGVNQVEATPVPIVTTDLARAATILPALDRDQVTVGALLPEPFRRAWFAGIADAARKGEFFFTLTVWIASGTR
jgi:SAM-dependent methyltransferase